MERRCDECGKLTSDGAQGDAGSEHEHLWYCIKCWQAWDTAHAVAWEAAHATACENGYTSQDLTSSEPPSVSHSAVAKSSELVSYGDAESLPTSSSLETAAKDLMLIADSKLREDAVQTIFKIIDAVIATPEDSKKRRMKKSNEAFNRKVGQHSAAIDFLHCVGFNDADDPVTGEGSLLVMPVAFIRRLVDGHECLARLAIERGINPPPLPKYFDPFKESIQHVGLAPTTRKKLSEEEIREREARRLEKSLEEAGPPIDMRPSVFWLAAGRKLQDVIRETLETDRGSGTSTKETTCTRNSKQCILRVVCPDKSALQVCFRAVEQVDHVVSQIAPLLSPRVQSVAWYLYTSPPLKRLGMAETLASAGLTPGANVYLGFDGERIAGPYLKPELMINLGPAPVEEPVAAESSMKKEEGGLVEK